MAASVQGMAVDIEVYKSDHCCIRIADTKVVVEGTAHTAIEQAASSTIAGRSTSRNDCSARGIKVDDLGSNTMAQSTENCPGYTNVGCGRIMSSSMVESTAEAAADFNRAADTGGGTTGADSRMNCIVNGPDPAGSSGFRRIYYLQPYHSPSQPF